MKRRCKVTVKRAKNAKRIAGFQAGPLDSSPKYNVRFSNRPVGVKRFQAIHGSGVDVSRGLVLLFGIGTPALVWELFSQEV